MPKKIIIADCSWNSIDVEKAQFPLDWTVEGHQCRTEEDVIRAASDADAILVEYAPITRRVLEGLKQCKIVSVTSTGYDCVDAEAAKELGVPVANVPDYCSGEVADHTLALILASRRNIVRYSDAIRSGVWDQDSVPPMNRLQGQTLGLVGFGNIARQVAQRAIAFGFRVAAFTSVPEEQVRGAGVEPLSLEELLAESDIVSCHVPLTQKNTDFFNKELFRKMKRKPLFVNTSRGKVVVEEDLVEALELGFISGAALDVMRSEPPDFSSPLFRMDNVIITPHAAFYSQEALEECRRRSARNVLDFFEGRTEFVNRV